MTTGHPQAGHGRGLGARRREPRRRLLRVAQGLSGPLRDLRAPCARAPRSRRGRAQPAQQPDARSLALGRTTHRQADPHGGAGSALWPCGSACSLGRGPHRSDALTWPGGGRAGGRSRRLIGRDHHGVSSTVARGAQMVGAEPPPIAATALDTSAVRSARVSAASSGHCSQEEMSAAPSSQTSAARGSSARLGEAGTPSGKSTSTRLRGARDMTRAGTAYRYHGPGFVGNAYIRPTRSSVARIRPHPIPASGHRPCRRRRERMLRNRARIHPPGRSRATSHCRTEA